MRPANDTFLRALLKEKTEYSPIWPMRQPGPIFQNIAQQEQRPAALWILQ